MFFVCILLAALLAGFSTGSADLLPPDDFLGKWRKDGPPRVFQGPDLYGHINGGSELFLEFGFEDLVVQHYRAGNSEFSLEVYRMTDPVAATGAYLMKKGPQSSSALAVPHTVSPYQLIFTRNRYLVVVNSTEGNEKDQKDLVEFGAWITSRLPETPPIRQFGTLPAAGLVSGSERLIRGMYALQAIFTLGPENVLSLAPGQTAVAGEYKGSRGTYTLILSDYPDPNSATRAFTHLASHLDPYLKPVDQNPSRLVFEDYAHEYGVVSVSGSRIEIRVHLAAKP